MGFDEYLRQAREAAGITQKELAKRANLSVATIQGYEQGKYKPRKDVLRILSDVLNVGYGYLEDGEPYFYTFHDVFDTDTNTLTIHRTGVELKDALSDSYEKTVIENYRKLNSTGKKKATDYIEDLTEIPKYKK